MDYYVGRLSDEYDFFVIFLSGGSISFVQALTDYSISSVSSLFSVVKFQTYFWQLCYYYDSKYQCVTLGRPQFSASNPQLRSVAIWEAVRTKFWVTYGSWKLPLPLLFVCSYHMWYARSRSLQHSWVHGLNANSARVIEDCDIWIQSTALNQKRFL